MHGPVYITEKQGRLIGDAKQDVVIHDARPDGRLKIQLEMQLDAEARWYDANGDPIETPMRQYRMFAFKGTERVNDSIAGEIDVPIWSDHGVQLLPADPELAREQARSQLLPEADATEFELIPMAGEEIKVPAVTGRMPEGTVEGLPKLVTFDTSEWDLARLSEMAFENELWVRVSHDGAEPDVIGIVSAFDETSETFRVTLHGGGGRELRGVQFDQLTVLGVTDE